MRRTSASSPPKTSTMAAAVRARLPLALPSPPLPRSTSSRRDYDQGILRANDERGRGWRQVATRPPAAAKPPAACSPTSPPGAVAAVKGIGPPLSEESVWI